MQGIRIDRLEVLIRGVSPDLVRLASDRMGNEVLEQLIQGHLYESAKPGGRIKRIRPDVLKIGKYESPSDLRRMIAHRVVESMTTQNRQAPKKER